MSKRLSAVEFGCVLRCYCSPSKSFMNRGFILLLKSGCVGHFGCLFDLVVWGEGKNDALNIFNKLHL